MSTVQVILPHRKIKPSLCTHETNIKSSNVKNNSQKIGDPCSTCEESHQLYVCPKFYTITVKENYFNRHEMFSVFRVSFCKRFKGVCKVCGQKNHHTLFHGMNYVNKSFSSPKPNRFSLTYEIPTQTNETPSIRFRVSSLCYHVRACQEIRP